MKRIIEGVTYNTDTATLVAQSTLEDDGVTTECALYQNRAGVYFGVDTVTTSYRDKSGEWNKRTAYDWTAVGDAAAARKYTEQYSMTILRDIEDMPPEAAFGEKLATVYLRVTPTLKAELDEVSSEGNVSGNLWATRCLERCLGMRNGVGLEDLFAIDQIAFSFSHDDAFGASREKCMEAISEIASLSESLAKHLFGGEDNVMEAQTSYYRSGLTSQRIRDTFGPAALEASAPNAA